MAKTKNNGVVTEAGPLPANMPLYEVFAADQLRHENLGESLIRALLSPVPRPLLTIDAELIMFAGQYLLHYKTETGASRYKFLTPGALRAAFSGQALDSGWLVPGVVRWGEGTGGKYAAMWIPPQKHSIPVDMAVDDEEPGGDGEGAGEGERVKVQRTQTEQLSVATPGFVLVGVGRSYGL